MEDFRKRISVKLAEFASGPKEGIIQFPKELTRAERKSVHHLAEALGLFTKSEGCDPDRFVLVAKKESSLADHAGDEGSGEKILSERTRDVHRMPGLPALDKGKKLDGGEEKKLVQRTALAPSPCRGLQSSGMGSSPHEDKPPGAVSQKAAYPKERGEGAMFLLVGFVDGTSEEAGRKLVVEMKHRMRKVYEPPPFRDTVQLCIYLRMLGCGEGDLVQCVRTGAKAERVSITRTRLEGEHDRGWREAVRPRLYRFAEAIYKFREDDNLRYRFLQCSTEERVSMIYKECDFLESF